MLDGEIPWSELRKFHMHGNFAVKPKGSGVMGIEWNADRSRALLLSRSWHCTHKRAQDVAFVLKEAIQCLDLSSPGIQLPLGLELPQVIYSSCWKAPLYSQALLVVWAGWFRMEAIRGYCVVWITWGDFCFCFPLMSFSQPFICRAYRLSFWERKKKEIHCGNLVEMRVIFQCSVVICLHFV